MTRSSDQNFGVCKYYNPDDISFTYMSGVLFSILHGNVFLGFSIWKLLNSDQVTEPTVGQSIHHIAHLLPNLNMCVCTYAKLNWPCLGKYLLFFYDKYAWIILLRPYCIVCLLGASIIHTTIIQYVTPFLRILCMTKIKLYTTPICISQVGIYVVGRRLNGLIWVQFALLF